MFFYILFSSYLLWYNTSSILLFIISSKYILYFPFITLASLHSYIDGNESRIHIPSCTKSYISTPFSTWIVLTRFIQKGLYFRAPSNMMQGRRGKNTLPSKPCQSYIEKSTNIGEAILEIIEIQYRKWLENIH